MKQKTYVITLSKTFPVTHARAGQPTDFKKKFLAAINSYGEWMKNHSLRANYELWKKRFVCVELSDVLDCDQTMQ